MLLYKLKSYTMESLRTHGARALLFYTLKDHSGKVQPETAVLYIMKSLRNEEPENSCSTHISITQERHSLRTTILHTMESPRQAKPQDCYFLHLESLRQAQLRTAVIHSTEALRCSLKTAVLYTLELLKAGTACEQLLYTP